MTVIQSWKQNLKMLQPQNIKNLGLLSVKLVKDNVLQVVMVTAAVIIVSLILFWAFGLIFAYATFLAYRNLQVNAYLARLLFSEINYFGLILGIVAALRSSVAKKDIAYYRDLFVSGFVAILAGLVLHALTIYIFSTYLFSIQYLNPLFDTILILMALLFFDRQLPKRRGIMAFIRQFNDAGKMIMYNIPIFIVVTVIAYSPKFIEYFFVMIKNVLFFGEFGILFILFEILVSFFVVVFIVTIYNALIYEQRDLYFKD